MSTQFTDVTSDDKLWALLSYIFSPLIPIVVLLMEDKKSRPFLKFHAMQSLILGIIAVICYVVLGFIFIGFCLGLAVLVYEIYIGIKAYKGETVEAPVIANFIKNQGWA
jgi:uncharacterized protein